MIRHHRDRWRCFGSATVCGWHAPEAAHRWIDGAATITACGAPALAFEIATTGRYWRWVAGVDVGLRRVRCVPVV